MERIKLYLHMWKLIGRATQISQLMIPKVVTLQSKWLSNWASKEICTWHNLQALSERMHCLKLWMCLPGAILAICIGYQAKLHNTSKFKHETFFAILKCISHENASLDGSKWLYFHLTNFKGSFKCGRVTNTIYLSSKEIWCCHSFRKGLLLNHLFFLPFKQLSLITMLHQLFHLEDTHRFHKHNITYH
mgnify:CR=1 FL=1